MGQKIRTALLSMLVATGLIYAESNAIKQEISVYGWLPSFNGTLTFNVPGNPGSGDGGEDGSRDSTSSKAIDGLDAIFMGSYTLRQGKWSFLADLIYIKVSGDSKGINTDVTWGLDVTAKQYGFYGGYTLSQTDKMRVDLLGGLRYFGVGVDVSRKGGEIANGSVETTLDSYDGVIGIGGQYMIDENWYIPYMVDIGAGDTDLTWQANVSIAYKLSWGDIIGTYRYIHYESDDFLLIKDLDLYGPKIGVVFHF